ncbi:MAG: ABC transporter ATP-binding protein, partial [Verrucomicrobiota bacterium]
MGEVRVHALRGITFDIFPGDYISIMGPSGCGKSTLLNVLGCLDRPTSGNYLLGGEDVSGMDDDALSAVRGSRLGFVFQSYNLIQQLTVLENIEIPLYYQGKPEDETRERARVLATKVGLADRLDHKPFELSGGQQQRVAIARALVNDPLLILADEPTSALDPISSQFIEETFGRLKNDYTIVLVTHVLRQAKRIADNVVFMYLGEVIEQGSTEEVFGNPKMEKTKLYLGGTFN